MSALPKFKENIQATREEEQGVVFFRIVDQEKPANLKLYEIEYLIALECNGNQSLADIQKQVLEKHQFSVTLADLQKFMKQLESMQLLEQNISDTFTEPQEDTHILKRDVSPEEKAEDTGAWQVAAVMNAAEEDVHEIVSTSHETTGEKRPSSSRSGVRRLTTVFYEETIKARLGWFIVLLVVLFAIGAGIFYISRRPDIVQQEIAVRTEVIQPNQLPVFYPEPAAEVAPDKESNLNFLTPGIVDTLFIEKGTRVQAEQVLAVLKMPPQAQSKLKSAREALVRAQTSYEKSQKPLEELLRDRQRIETEKMAIDEMLKELRPKSILSDGGVSSRDIEKLKQAKVDANRKLSAVAVKERKPKAAEAKAKKQLEAAKKKLQTLEKQYSAKILRAPFEGSIVELRVAKGQKVTPTDVIAVLRDALHIRLSFVVTANSTLQNGGETFVSLRQGKPSSAKIIDIQSQQNKKIVQIKFPDPTGTFVQIAAKEFSLVREFIENAVLVPSKAIILVENIPFIYLALGDRAVLRPVEILQKEAVNTIIRDPKNTLRENDRVIVAEKDSGEIKRLSDGALIKVQ